MRRFFYILLLFVKTVAAQSDNQSLLLRSTLGLSGGSFSLSAKNSIYIVHHSIGQLSPIGAVQLKEHLIIQGFIQPIFLFSAVNQEIDLGRIAIIFPNPFKQSINLSFLEKINTPLEVSLYSIQGQRIYSTQFAVSQRIKINPPTLYNAAYILKVRANNQQFSRAIIKN